VAPPIGEPARPDRARSETRLDRPRGDSRRAPHKTYATWEPPVDADDDKPILPGITVSDAPLGDAATTESMRPSVEERDDPDFAQIFINVGRRDGARPADFEKMLAETAGLAPADTGSIRVRDRNTFVSVRKTSIERVVAALVGQTIAGRRVLAEPAKPRTP
jgi:ATP-dependent RNA helicase DeaD